MHQDRRRAWARAVLVIVALLALLVVLAPAATAQSQPGPTTTTTAPSAGQGACDSITNPAARSVCQAGTAPGRAIGGAVSGAAQNVVQTAGDSALRSLTAAVASAGKFFLERIGRMIQATTSPNVVTAGWFTSQYRVMLALAVVIALPILLVSVAQSIVRADGMQALRSAFVYLPIADSATPTAASQLIPEAQQFKEFNYAPGS